MNNLSDREQKILDYMKEYLAKWGYPPTVRDIGSALGIKSTSTVHKAIASLEEKGCIKKQAGKRRALDIIGSEPRRRKSKASRTKETTWWIFP